MNIRQNKRYLEGFTLIEIIVVITLVALIAGVVFSSVRASKNKAIDADTRKVMSEIALKAEGQEIAQGVIDYNKAFTAIAAPATLTELATKLNLAPTDYQYVSSASEYAIVFPLKKGGYYCIDSVGHATGKEVIGLFAESGQKNCDTATRVVTRPLGWDTGSTTERNGSSSGQVPVITLFGPNPDSQIYYIDTPGSYNEPGYTASDTEDGDVTPSVVVTSVVLTMDCHADTYKRYTVTDSAGNTTTVDRMTDGVQPVTAQPVCGNIPIDPQQPE